MKKLTSTHPLAVYVHVPFCLSKCKYCDFVSGIPAVPEIMDRYAHTVSREIESLPRSFEGRRIRTIYFGGGTPSLLPPANLDRIIRALKKRCEIDKKAEFNLEMNPATGERQKLEMFRQMGVNRISLGVQSFSDRFLKVLGRTHNRETVKSCLARLRQTRFNFSLDLIYGLPEQSLEDWLDDLRTAIGEDPDHISFYELKIEPGTEFWRQRRKLNLPDNDLLTRMYLNGIRFLEKNNFIHYEVSSFCRPRRQCRHNMVYWRNEEYLGLGVSSASYLNYARFRRTRNLSKYLEQAETGFRRYASETLSPEQRLRESLCLNLRLLKGGRLRELEKREKINVDDNLKRLISELRQERLILGEPDYFRLSRRGLLYADNIAGRILNC